MKILKKVTLAMVAPWKQWLASENVAYDSSFATSNAARAKTQYSHQKIRSS